MPTSTYRSRHRVDLLLQLSKLAVLRAIARKGEHSLPYNFGSDALGVFPLATNLSVVSGYQGLRAVKPPTGHDPRSCDQAATSRKRFSVLPRFHVSSRHSSMGATTDSLTRDFSPAHRPLSSGFSVSVAALMPVFSPSMVSAFPR